MTDQGDLVTPDEAARLLGLTRQRVHELIASGALASRRSARHVYVDRISLEQRIDSNKVIEEWMSTDQVAAVFDVSTKTVRRWNHDGYLHPIAPHGRALRYDPAEIREFRPPLLGGGARQKNRRKKGT